MPCRRYILYLAWNRNKYRMGISANPQIDLVYLQNQEGYENLAYMSPPLPLAVGEHLLDLTANAQEKSGKPCKPFLNISCGKNPQVFTRAIIKRKFRQVKKELARLGEEYMAREPVVFTSSTASVDYFTLQHYEEVLDSILQGRIFYRQEIIRRLRERDIEMEDLEDVLHLLTLKGVIIRVPSINMSAGGGTGCNRCGHQNRIVRAYCQTGQRECYYCEECLMLGQSRPCEALYAAPVKPRIEESFVRSVRLSLDITFSLAQYEAFESLARFVRKDNLKECLVWEACGAGRPEVIFGAVREALKRGGRVLFGVPRRDILDDLVFRLEKAFPGVTVAVRYGKAKAYLRGSDIVLASTHEVLKYYRNFELVILDESDAFPYRANPILLNALRRARKPEGRFVYMTPTPAPGVYARAQRGEVKLIQISMRPHGNPLVVPRVVVDPQINNENKLSDLVYGLVRESLEEDHAQVLVVVPDAYQSQRMGEALMRRLEADNPAGLKELPIVHTSSFDSLRDKKVSAYFRGEHNVLVTTNLTSRGDRAPNSNVIVLWADNEIFDEGALLQLASRIGWSEAYPGGKAWFVASRITRDMEGAMRKIRLLNEEAQKRGYLDSGTPKKNSVKS